jgi:hypothetical protein
MKTMTEFFGRTLTEAQGQVNTWIKELTESTTTTLTASITERLTTEGKTAEEIPALLAEALKTEVKPAVDAELKNKITEKYKLEGEKADWFITALRALETHKSKRGLLKRVLVATANEGEKAPSSFTEVNGKYFAIEFYPEPAGSQKRPSGPRDRFSKGDKRGAKNGKGKRNFNDRKRTTEGPVTETANATPSKNVRPRRPRAEPGVPVTQVGGKALAPLKPKSVSTTTTAPTPTTETAAAPHAE